MWYCKRQETSLTWGACLPMLQHRDHEIKQKGERGFRRSACVHIPSLTGISVDMLHFGPRWWRKGRNWTVKLHNYRWNVIYAKLQCFLCGLHVSSTHQKAFFVWYNSITFLQLFWTQSADTVALWQRASVYGASQRSVYTASNPAPCPSSTWHAQSESPPTPPPALFLIPDWSNCSPACCSTLSPTPPNPLLLFIHVDPRVFNA